MASAVRGADGQLGRPASQTAADHRLTVEAILRPTSAYVGQGVEVQVAVVASEDEPEVTAPKVDGGELTLFDRESQRVNVTAIGDSQDAQTVYRFRYRLIPRKVGTLTIPPFQGRLGDRRGSSSALKLRVVEVPREGRTADFLGGAGTFDLLRATAEPDSVRAGQEFTYRVEMQGTSARGTAHPPELQRLRRANPELEISQRPGESSDTPPKRTFQWRIRPKRGGELKIPPLSIAVFDPKLNRYLTKATQGLSVKVADLPSFDPKSLDYSPKVTKTERRPDGKLTVIGGVVLSAFGLTALVVIRAFFRRKARMRRANGLIATLQKQILRAQGCAELALAVNESLKTYLSFHSLHETGALTPLDAGRGVESRTRSKALAERAKNLIADADRLSFGGEAATGEFDTLRLKALRFFEDLATKGT